MVDSSLILDFSLQEVVRSCLGLKLRFTHCCMGIVDEGSGGGRSGCRRDLDEGGGKACAGSGRGCLRWLVTAASASSPRRRARARAPTADVRPPRARAGASTCLGCRCLAAMLNKWTFCSSTVPTDWTITVTQREIKRLWPGTFQLLGKTRHFGSITSLLPAFPHYYHQWSIIIITY